MRPRNYIKNIERYCKRGVILIDYEDKAAKFKVSLIKENKKLYGQITTKWIVNFMREWDIAIKTIKKGKVS